MTEKWVKFPGMKMGVRKDLFGFIDVVAVGPAGTIGVQATSDTNIQARIRKITMEPKAMRWLSGGNRIAVVGWRKQKTGRYTVKQMEGILQYDKFKNPYIDWVEACFDLKQEGEENGR